MSVRVSVIVPARNAAAELPRCLAALWKASEAGVATEMVVVVDGPDVATSDAALQATTRIIQLQSTLGAANARNAGASAACGEILVFVDADVVVHPDAIAQLVAIFDLDATVAAVFGAYDDSPATQTIVSQYVNLVHHFVHRRHAGNAVTFWAGLGAVRRSAFDAVGGFDALRFRRAQIEDVELGFRLSDAGFRVISDPTIQGTHLKHWTLAAFFTAGVRDRAIPWIRLLIERRKAGLPTDAMDVNRREGILTVAVVAGCTLLAVSLAGADGRLATLGATLLVAVIAANWPLFAFLGQRRGTAMAICAVPLRLASYLINAIGTAAGTARCVFAKPS